MEDQTLNKPKLTSGLFQSFLEQFNDEQYDSEQLVIQQNGKIKSLQQEVAQLQHERFTKSEQETKNAMAGTLIATMGGFPTPQQIGTVGVSMLVRLFEMKAQDRDTYLKEFFDHSRQLINSTIDDSSRVHQEGQAPT